MLTLREANSSVLKLAPGGLSCAKGHLLAPAIRWRRGGHGAVRAMAAQPSSTGTISEQVFFEAERILPVLGVNTSEPRLSLALAVGAQAGKKVEEGLLSLVGEATRYSSGSRRESQPANWEEALMTVPDLETIPYKVVESIKGVEIRAVQSYLVAETTMAPQSQGFDFLGSGQAFNTLAGYLFGKNKARTGMDMTTPVISRSGAQSGGQAMEMTTPVITRKEGRNSQGRSMEMTTPVITRPASGGSTGKAMEMTTPVINSKAAGEGWSMSFVIPSEFNESNIPIPEDSAVNIRRIPARTVAVLAFSGYVTDADVARRERMLRDTVAQMSGYKAVPGAEVEVLQYNPPFTLPFFRRNEVSLEVTEVA